MPLFSKNKPFTRLHKRALIEHSKSYDKETGGFSSPKKAPPVTLTPAERTQEAVNFFLSAGLDYKGQSQCCFETKGGGLQIDVSIDPAQIFFGFFKTEISLSAGVTRSKEAMIVAQRGPFAIADLKAPRPIMLNCLIGAHWEGMVSAGVEIAVGIKYSIGVGDSEGNVEKSWEPDDDNKLELESIGFKAEAKAGLEVEAGSNYENFYAEDVCPLSYDTIADARRVLGELFTAGSYKAIVKKDACDFINANILYFKKIKYEGLIWGHISSKDIIKVLANGLSQKALPPAKITLQALAFIDSLQCWAEDGSKPFIPTCIRISTHKANAKAGLVASAKVSAQAIVASVDVGVSAEALTISGQYKNSTVRYQTVYPAAYRDLKKVYLVMTQDCKLVYKQIDFTTASIKGEVSATVAMSSKGFELEGKLGEVELLNTMSYIATTVFWATSGELPSLAKKQKQVKKYQGEALAGTGISIGGSFQVESLKKFYGYYDKGSKEWSGGEKYFTALAKSLSVTLDELIMFFNRMDDMYKANDGHGAFVFLNELANANGVQALLLEASFRVENFAFTAQSTVEGENKIVELDPKTAKQLLALPGQRKLEAIRMRYRIQDTFNGDGSGFSLGFKQAGTGAGIKLKKVDRAGSEGIVDLCTIWLAPDLVSLDSDTAYEQAVPPVALFCQ